MSLISGMGRSQPNNVTHPSPISQHKRSLSFNHHFSYNQYHSQQQNIYPMQKDKIELLLERKNVNSAKGTYASILIMNWSGLAK